MINFKFKICLFLLKLNCRLEYVTFIANTLNLNSVVHIVFSKHFPAGLFASKCVGLLLALFDVSSFSIGGGLRGG